MCKHIMNAQVSIRAPCCRRWFDCVRCHTDHELERRREIVLACKKCKNVWRLDLGDLDETDNYCPKCDNCFNLEAETPKEPAMMVQFESDTGFDSRVRPRDADMKPSVEFSDQFRR